MDSAAEPEDLPQYAGLEKAEATHMLAANQGLYKVFLAAGLLYGVATGSREICLFFLLCVVTADSTAGTA